MDSLLPAVKCKVITPTIVTRVPEKNGRTTYEETKKRLAEKPRLSVDSWKGDVVRDIQEQTRLIKYVGFV